MASFHEDQAAGLRRLFRRAPPAVVAIHGTGHHGPQSTTALACRLAGGALRVLMLDELGDGSVSPDGQPRLELLHALDGRVAPADLCLSLAPGVDRVAVATTALTLPLLDDTRRARLVSVLESLHRHAGFVLVRAGHGPRPSALVEAAPRQLVLAEASGRGATEAYAAIKRLAAMGAGSVMVAVARARGRQDAACFFESLEALARRHVGVPLVWLGEMERDDLGQALAASGPASGPREASLAFLRRLANLGARPLVGADVVGGRP